MEAKKTILDVAAEKSSGLLAECYSGSDKIISNQPIFPAPLSTGGVLKGVRTVQKCAVGEWWYDTTILGVYDIAID